MLNLLTLFNTFYSVCKCRYNIVVGWNVSPSYCKYFNFYIGSILFNKRKA